MTSEVSYTFDDGKGGKIVIRGLVWLSHRTIPPTLMGTTRERAEQLAAEAMKARTP